MRSADLCRTYASRDAQSTIRRAGKVAIYYGAADSYVGLAFTELDDIIDYIKEHSVVTTTDTEIGKR